MILPGPSLNSHEISNSLRLLMTRFRKLMLIPPSHLSLSLPPPHLLPSSCLRLSPAITCLALQPLSSTLQSTLCSLHFSLSP